MAQTSEELHAALKLLKTKSRTKEKAYGFVIIPAADDGIPAMYISKNETKARNEAKLELKTAKKKQMIVGKIFWDNGQLSVLPTKRKLKLAVIDRLFKKMAKKHSSGLGSMGAALKKGANLIEEALEPAVEEEATPQTGSNSKKVIEKSMKYIQKVKELYDDLIAKHADTEEMFSDAIKQGSSNPSLISELEKLINNLETEASKFPAFEKSIAASEGKLNEIKPEKFAQFKDNLKSIATDINKSEAELDKLIAKYQNLAFGDVGEDQDITTASRVDTLLLLAQAQEKKLKALVKGIDKSQKEKRAKGKMTIAGMTSFISELNVAQKNEELGTLSDKEFSELEKKWKLLAQLALEFMLEAQGAVPSAKERREKEFKQVLLSSRMELQRFISAVLSHPIIKADFQYSYIESELRKKNIIWKYIEITDNNKKKFSELFKKENEDLYNFAKRVEKDTTFGTFKPTSIIKTYIKSI